MRPAGQTGLRVEVILRLPKTTLQGYRGKSGGRLDAFHPPFPSPAAFLAVPDGTMALARGGTPIVSGGRFRYLIKKYWRQSAAISQQLLSETILMTLSENLGEEF